MHEPTFRRDAHVVGLDVAMHDALAVQRAEAARELREAIASAWVEAFPSAAMTVGLGDFLFHRLRVEGGRLISGFARAAALQPGHFAAAADLDT